MKNILLVCNAGMSTSVLVKKMQKVAEEKGVDATIWATSEAEIENEWRKADVILLGPQIRFLKGDIEKIVDGKVNVEAIDFMTYGAMNGEKVLELALSLIK
ncbi:PTS sugar transporter subunit IIB [Clostridium oceanicum]|uniref:PTS sugar transporter subunit IIB n=1 Tax=Clostridium oceanicum TaxID=1543 RepID=A0ABP3UUZ8_9CLOT